MAAPALEIRQLSVVRDGAVLLDRVDWTVPAGEHQVVLGPNGSGKSTLLGVLLGYVPFSEGRISVLGREFGRSDWRELRRAVGIVGPVVAQSVSDREIVVELVASGATGVINTWHEPGPAEIEASREALDELGLGRLAPALWGTLSQGERQKVLTARALRSGHEVLLLDEPCAGLDPRAREEYLRFLERIAGDAEKRATIVLVTHHVEEIRPFFSGVLMLREGGVQAQGPPDDVLGDDALSELFSCRFRLERGSGGRYRLRLE